MAVTRERKLEVALRSHHLLTGKYGVPATDLIFDPLVFPAATGDKQYLGSARETVEGIRLIKQALPDCKTIAGVSNVSFGLPPAGREVLNSVFLYHCTRAGLDMAIVNTEKLERYPSIPEDERRLAEALLFSPGDETVAAFAAHFRGAAQRVKQDATRLSLDERLAGYILEGSKDGLVQDLELARRDRAPLAIINGPLMAGMDEVGRLFNANELIVAEVLQSAEAMKAAVAHLEPFMEKADTASRGKVLLATVKGDVHDIGKNLVEIILANNGYEVVNLGIKVPPHELVEGVRKHRPDIIGLSGLLVKSAQMMVETGAELHKAGIALPLLVGGAALTRSFTRKRIAPAYGAPVVYCQDAMNGLETAGRLLDPEALKPLLAELEQEAKRFAGGETATTAPVVRGTSRSSRVRVLEASELKIPPDLERHVMKQLSLDEVWRYINPAMLYNKHLGFKGKWDPALAQGDPKAEALAATIAGLQAECRRGGLMTARAVWQFFAAASEGNALLLFAPGEREPVARFEFPREAGDDGRSISDHVRPVGHAPRDAVALFVTTAGEGVRALYERWKAEGEYLKSHAIQALAVETAEAAAEWLHARLRGQWGFPDEATATMSDRFQARYRGRRYSFGYPACPALEDQAKLFALLRPEEIGVSLTEGFMMEPEASVSALVVHHPDAAYFAV
jgi:5-methyltetrahydrofolate--homocysteine methyltransferase